MESNLVIQSFLALGHRGRLAVFRMLMRLAPLGGRPTEIAAALGLKQNTLSHHLAELEACGLIRCERQGRSLVYSVDLNKTAALVDYLVRDCGRGRADLMCQDDQETIATALKQPPYRVLFICSGNSARSIFAEAILNHVGAGKFQAYSAGTRPGSALNPLAVEVLARNGLATQSLRAKHIDEFKVAGAPQMDFVFTVCDGAAAEECPPWPGQPVTAHWGLPDPVKAVGTQAERALAFSDAFAALYRRISAFAALPIDELSRLTLQRDVDHIALM